MVLCVWCAVGLATAITVYATDASATVSALLVGLAVVTGALGWYAAETARVALEKANERRTLELKKTLAELEVAQTETVRRLSMAVEFRDEDTGKHVERIGRFSVLLAEQIGMDSEFCKRIRHAAPLHDVGKVAIPDHILLKPGPLTPEERAIVETHTEEGYRLVRGSSSAILDMAATIALSHQEKWDGSGYPRGLKGEAIPIEGRIVAVADVFDALTSDRVYRPAFPLHEAIRMMREERGTHFDPVLLDAFMEVLEEHGTDGVGGGPPDPEAIVEETLETFVSALGRGEAEGAEEAIVAAIDAGVTPTMLHAEVISPSLRRVSVLRASGEIDEDRERRALSIIKRVLATLSRYMTADARPTRQRVLVAGVEGDSHTLGLQMVHDQLAAAGFRTMLDTDLAPEDLMETVTLRHPDVVVVGDPVHEIEDSVEIAIRDLRSQHPEIPIVLGGPAVGGSIPADELAGVSVLERIDESVPVVEHLLAAPPAPATPVSHA
ncbi:MAG TPA: HD domain-containing phosphohydrolase [Solirubrobacteraceae bacterium]|nr:HD domain-containing phosphohydrolase [Solirubrobacteraceae bacterium]